MRLPPGVLRGDSGGRPVAPRRGRPPKAKPPRSNRTAGVPGDPYAGQLRSVFGPYESWLNKQIGSLQAESKRKAELQQNLARGYAEWYGRTGPSQIQGIYGQAATNQAAFGKGFSDGMQIAQQQLADSANKQIANAGGTPLTVGPEGANVVYGLGGYIPANTLNAQGAAFGSAAALMPAALLASGGQRAAKVREEYSKQIAELRGKQADLKSKKAEARGKLMDARREEATKAYNDGLITQRQYARILGLRDWRKYPNQRKPADHGGIDASASKLRGFLVYDDGTDVLDRKGNPIPIQQGANTYQQGGYFWSVDPVTGAVTKLGGPGPTSSGGGGGSSGGGSSSESYSVDPTVKADASVYAKQAFFNTVEKKLPGRYQGTKWIPGGTKKVRKTMQWEDAVNFVLSHLYKGTPRWVAEDALRRWYKPGKYGTPKASAVRSGGRQNASYSLGTSVIDTAKQAIGENYVWGGESYAEGGFDCSGLLYWAFAQHGISIPRTSQTQWRYGTPVAANDLQPGDAVFFAGYTGGKGGPGHVGLYLGNGMILEAPRRGTTVRIAPLSSHNGYMGARRFTNRAGKV